MKPAGPAFSFSSLPRLGAAILAGNGVKGMAGPVLIIMILGMMILPLPPFLLDLLFTFNIALSVMVLLVSMYTMKRWISPPSRRSCCFLPCCACRSTWLPPAWCCWRAIPGRTPPAR